MALETVLLDRAVFEFRLVHEPAQILMAIQTEPFATFDEVERKVGGMSVMASIATAFPCDDVVASGLLWNDGFVAGPADPACFGGKELSVGRGVGVMTLRTLSALHLRMDRGLLQFFLKFRMAFKAKLSRSACLEPESVLQAVAQGRASKENKEKKNQTVSAELHPYPFHVATLLHRRSCPLGFLRIYLVTLFTGSPGKRAMNRRFEKLRIFGGVRFMAFHAVHHLWLDADVGLPERPGLWVMARCAEGVKRLEE